MSLYAEWRNLCDNHANNDEEIKFWENYLKSEAGIYNEILNNKTDVVEGTVAELAAKYNVSNELFMGFLGDPRHEQIVFADIHIEVAEAVGAEIEPLGESVVLAHAPVGSAAYGA